jgi:hypothetical protein
VKVIGPQLQRHASCLCGSGRPLADCCLPWEEAFRRLVARLAAFSGTDAVRRLAARAGEVFWKSDVPKSAAPGRGAGSDACFSEWFLQDYVAPKHTGSLLGEFADVAARLRAREEQLLFAMLLTPVRPFQVMEPPGPRGMPVKDLLTGSEAVSGCLGLPDGLIHSDVFVGRLLPFGRLRRPGISLLRFPPGSQGELLAYLRAAYGVSRPGRHVSFEDYVDGAAHLYHHFFLDRGRELGGRAHRTCRWAPFAVGRVRYHAVETARIRAALARQSALELVEEEEGRRRYLWVDRVHAVVLGTILVHPDEIEVSAETIEDLAKLTEFLEACLRGLVQRVPADAVPSGAPAMEPTAQQTSVPAGTAFIRRMLDGWPDAPYALLSDRTPREACRSKAGRGEVVNALLGLERDMARQKRLGRAWGEGGPLWEQLNLARPLPPHASAGEQTVPRFAAGERRSVAKR